MFHWRTQTVLFSSLLLDPNKVCAIQAWPTPTDDSTLYQFLGLDFIEYMHKNLLMLLPLHGSMRKGVPFEWTSVHDNAPSFLK